MLQTMLPSEIGHRLCRSFLHIFVFDIQKLKRLAQSGGHDRIGGENIAPSFRDLRCKVCCQDKWTLNAETLATRTLRLRTMSAGSRYSTT